jgi:hypothetical protein
VLFAKQLSLENFSRVLSDLIRWHQMTLLTRNIETQLKKSGINQQSLTYFEKNEFTFPEGELLNFEQNICDYIVVQSSHIKEGKTFLATSDVIESLFGKYNTKFGQLVFPTLKHGWLKFLVNLCSRKEKHYFQRNFDDTEIA